MFFFCLEEEVKGRLEAVILLSTAMIFNTIIAQCPLYILPRYIDEISTPCINTIKGILPAACFICGQRNPAKCSTVPQTSYATRHMSVGNAPAPITLLKGINQIGIQSRHIVSRFVVGLQGHKVTILFT